MIIMKVKYTYSNTLILHRKVSRFQYYAGFNVHLIIIEPMSIVVKGI